MLTGTQGGVRNVKDILEWLVIESLICMAKIVTGMLHCRYILHTVLRVKCSSEQGQKLATNERWTVIIIHFSWLRPNDVILAHLKKIDLANKSFGDFSRSIVSNRVALYINMYGMSKPGSRAPSSITKSNLKVTIFRNTISTFSNAVTWRTMNYARMSLSTFGELLWLDKLAEKGPKSDFLVL